MLWPMSGTDHCLYYMWLSNHVDLAVGLNGGPVVSLDAVNELIGATVILGVNNSENSFSARTHTHIGY